MEERIPSEPEIVVGLDIGTTKIATIIGYKNESGKIDVLGYGKGESTGVQHGLILNITKTINGINTSKDLALKRAGKETEDINGKVFVGVAGRHIKSFEYKHSIIRNKKAGDVIEEEEINNMIHEIERIQVAPGEEIITVIPQRFIIDDKNETTEPVGMLGRTICGYFQIITGNKSEIDKILQCVNATGLHIEDITLEPIASSMSCLTEEEKKHGVVLIDIGGGTTDIAIYHNGNPVFTKVIPIGGNVITSDIAQICKITDEMAEKLKIRFGTCFVDKSDSNNHIDIPQFGHPEPVEITETYLAQIIYARVNEILQKVKVEIANSGYAHKIQTNIVLTGGGSMLKDLRELCEFTLSMPTRIGIPDKGFVSTIAKELKHPIYSTSMGLLKYGIEYFEKKKSQNDEPILVEPRRPGKPNKENNKDKKNGGKTPGPKPKDLWDKIQEFFKKLLIEDETA